MVVGFRPQLQPQHELALQGMRRLSPPRQHRTAVSIAMLRVIADAADMSSAQHRVICGAAVLGFFFASEEPNSSLREEEVHIYCLQVGDVSVADSTGMKTLAFNSAASVRINLRGSKTDQSGQSTSRLLLKSEQAPVCPVFAALLLQRNAAAIGLPLDAPLCSINRRSVLSADTMTKVLRKAAVKCNIQPDGVSTHSLRTGGATALHDAGVDADTIRMHRRMHISSMFVKRQQHRSTSRDGWDGQPEESRLEIRLGLSIIGVARVQTPAQSIRITRMKCLSPHHAGEVLKEMVISRHSRRSCF